MSDPSDLPCARCGYDLRVHPRDAVCPECETPVAEAIALAALPARPAWRDSDPRWRRRMLAGAWIIVLIPLMEVLQQSGLASKVPVVYYDFQGFSRATLDTSIVTWLYAYLVFCIGMVLFFSKERYRRPHRLDWTRRWGVFGSYLVLLLGIPIFATLSALVLIGIAALFMSLPLAYQPAGTDLLRRLGVYYIYYGPEASEAVDAALSAASACVVLLACVPIHEALRSTGLRVLAWVLLVPLGLMGVLQLVGAVHFYLNPAPTASPPPLFFFGLWLPGWQGGEWSIGRDISMTLRWTGEAVKWLIFLAIAVWLSIAQVRAWRKPLSR